MKSKTIKILNLIVAVLVCALAAGYAFAWLAESRKTDSADFNGSSGSTYFAGGDGSSGDPFIINDKYHMYNLAWLQNTGKLTQKYYFEMDKDLTIPDNFWLPPIGTDDYPFIGDFNGNGYTVSGLLITTDRSKLGNAGLPGGAGDFSNAVGMFGMTGAGSEIHNFILEDPVVEVASANATYSQEAERTAGIAVGLVGGKAYSVGVLAQQGTAGATLIMNRGGYSTFNSIIGALADNVSSSVTGGGNGIGGSGSAFGANFDVVGMVTRLNLIYNKTSWRLPSLENSTTLADGEKIPFTVINDITEDYYSASAAEEVVANSNVGYFLGNQNKFQSKTLTFSEKLVKDEESGNWAFSGGELPSDVKRFPNWFYKVGSTQNGVFVYNEYNYFDSSTPYNGFEEITAEEYANLPDSIKQLLIVDENNNTKDLSSKTEQKTYQTVRLGAQYWGDKMIRLSESVTVTDGNVAWAYHGQINWNGKTYGDGFRYSDGYAVDVNGNYLSRSGESNSSSKVGFNGMIAGVPLPSNAIWFKPVRAGTIRLVLYSETAGDAFALVKCNRTYASEEDPFALQAAKGVDTGDGWGDLTSGWGATYATAEYVFMHELPSRVLFYYEYEITENDMVNGTYPEFMLCKGNTEEGGSYFVYLDIGASEADDTDNSVIDPDTDVSAVDFIYRGVTIAQEDTAVSADNIIKAGNFIVTASGSTSLYEAAKTSIYFENLNTVLEMVFARPENGRDESGITLTVTVTPSDGVGEIKQTKSTASILSVSA